MDNLTSSDIGRSATTRSGETDFSRKRHEWKSEWAVPRKM